MERLKAFISKFTPYLEDIRKRLYAIAIFFIIFFVLGFFSTGSVLKYILSFFNIKDVVIATTSPFQFADLSINIGLFTAFLISCPILVYHIFMFLKPALTKKEKGLFFFFAARYPAIIFYGFRLRFLDTLLCTYSACTNK